MATPLVRLLVAAELIVFAATTVVAGVGDFRAIRGAPEVHRTATSYYRADAPSIGAAAVGTLILLGPQVVVALFGGAILRQRRDDPGRVMRDTALWLVAIDTVLLMLFLLAAASVM